MDTAKLKELAIEGKLADVAEENMGIYPQSITGGEGAYEKRSDWQEGWNAAVIAYGEKCSVLSRWHSSIPTAFVCLVDDLLLTGKIDVSVDDDCSLYVNCSDVFFWGCSDGEDITFDELAALSECYELSPKHGGDLWCCRKRECRPQMAAYREWYPPSEWHLFDACGPVRDDPDGKGREKLSAAT